MITAQQHSYRKSVPRPPKTTQWVTTTTLWRHQSTLRTRGQSWPKIEPKDSFQRPRLHSKMPRRPRLSIRRKRTRRPQLRRLEPRPKNNIVSSSVKRKLQNWRQKRLLRLWKRSKTALLSIWWKSEKIELISKKCANKRLTKERRSAQGKLPQTRPSKTLKMRLRGSVLSTTRESTSPWNKDQSQIENLMRLLQLRSERL